MLMLYRISLKRRTVHLSKPGLDRGGGGTVVADEKHGIILVNSAGEEYFL